MMAFPIHLRLSRSYSQTSWSGGKNTGVDSFGGIDGCLGVGNTGAEGVHPLLDVFRFRTSSIFKQVSLDVSLSVVNLKHHVKTSLLHVGLYRVHPWIEGDLWSLLFGSNVSVLWQSFCSDLFNLIFRFEIGRMACHRWLGSGSTIRGAVWTSYPLRIPLSASDSGRYHDQLFGYNHD